MGSNKKKPRTKKYKPRQVNIPPFLLKQEPSRDMIASFERRIRDIYLQLHLGSADRETLFELVRHFLLGAAIRERYTEEAAIFDELVRATRPCIDAMIALEDGEEPDWNAVRETEPAANLVIELISKGKALGSLVEMEWLREESPRIVNDLIRNRRKDIAEGKLQKDA